MDSGGFRITRVGLPFVRFAGVGLFLCAVLSEISTDRLCLIGGKMRDKSLLSVEAEKDLKFT